MPLEYLWKLKAQPDPHTISAFKKALNISDTFLTLLVQKGINNRSQAEAFFNPNLQGLHNPFLMKDMDRAIARINLAKNSAEKIMVYGDYDVDGTTAVAVFSAFLEKHYPNVITYIPDRYKEGYGISQAGIDFAAEE
jgi:single-stranded-DNA-specific exonuclease